MAIADFFEWTIDFQGQKLADQLAHGILILFAVAGFVIGYVNQDLLLTITIFGAGVALSFLVALPPWPFYNKHPLKWLPVLSTEEKK